jgi:hypothetical protein
MTKIAAASATKRRSIASSRYQDASLRHLAIRRREGSASSGIKEI